MSDTEFQTLQNEMGFVELYKQSTGVTLPWRADAATVDKSLMDETQAGSVSSQFDITD